MDVVDEVVFLTAMIYQHAVRGADQMIRDAIDQQLKQQNEGDSDGSAGVLAPVG
ncbi:hypothetical protein [Nonomuraea jabiensis]|uniref:hypothetical protein n=1 Tax=Nonomuraea jabiensis TaxID=882448 RepID=UPI003D7306D5